MTDNLDPTTTAITISTLWLLVGYQRWMLPALARRHRDSADPHI